MRKLFQFLNLAYGFIANTLQISGLSFSALITLLVGVIGKLRNVDPFLIACSIPISFALTAYGFTKVRSLTRAAQPRRQRTFKEMAKIMYPKPPLWRRVLNKLKSGTAPEAMPTAVAPATPPAPVPAHVEWLRPAVAMDALANPELVRNREARLAQMHEAENRVRAQRARQNVELLRKAGIQRVFPEQPAPNPWLDEVLKAAGLVNQEALEQRFNQANAEVMADIHTKLTTGEVRARGLIPPLSADSREVDIPTVHWRFLRLDVPQETASGQGVTYVAVVLAKATAKAQ